MKSSFMPQKDKSITTLSKSATSSAYKTGPETPIQFIKGVGPKLGAIFNSRDIETVRDLLHFFPRDYEDRSQVATIAGLTDGIKATVTVKVLSQRQIPIQKLGRSMLEV